MKDAPRITREAVKTQIEGQHPCVLIDVLPGEFFDQAHLPGAKNACVYEVDFLEQVQKLAPDKESMMIVYGSGTGSLASATAAEKLIATGYRNVHDYRGGFEDWAGAGWAVEGDVERTKTDTQLRDGIFEIDCEESKVEWTGRSIANSHQGVVKLSHGTITVENGRAARGAFTMDMRSIQNSDIEDSSMAQLLVSHLKSDDFFDVDRFPTAEFRLTQITPLEGATPGSANSNVIGELTVKGVTQQIAFPAVIGSTADGRCAAETHFDIDRTRWNVLYGSGKFYDKLGKHLVHDEITISLKLVAVS